VDKEIEYLKKIYEHEKSGGGIRTRPSFNYLNLRNTCIDPFEIYVIRQAAAAHNDMGISYDESTVYNLCGYSAVVLTSDVLSPIGLMGQTLLLDPEEKEPKNGDLVIVETNDEKRYARRFWKKDDETIILESTNPTKLFQPIEITNEHNKYRRIVGIFFSRIDDIKKDQDSEWLPRSLSE
jgi:hypothetical protein